MKIKSIITNIIFLTSLCVTLPTFAVTAHDLIYYASDTMITTSIRTKLLQQQSFSSFKINVNTDNGIVMLSGPVETDAQASDLIQLATNTNGVKDVNASKLIVANSEQPLNDTAITAKIKGLFARYKLFGSENAPMTIQVETDHGVVYLSGMADNEKQYRSAIEIAASISGVDHVESSVRIKEEKRKSVGAHEQKHS